MLHNICSISRKIGYNKDVSNCCGPFAPKQAPKQ